MKLVRERLRELEEEIKIKYEFIKVHKEEHEKQCNASGMCSDIQDFQERIIVLRGEAWGLRFALAENEKAVEEFKRILKREINVFPDDFKTELELKKVYQACLNKFDELFGGEK